MTSEHQIAMKIENAVVFLKKLTSLTYQFNRRPYGQISHSKASRKIFLACIFRSLPSVPLNVDKFRMQS